MGDVIGDNKKAEYWVWNLKSLWLVIAEAPWPRCSNTHRFRSLDAGKGSFTMKSERYE